MVGKSKFRELLVHHLDLLVEHLSGKSVDGYMHPVMLFTFHDEIALEIGGVWLETT
jgi:hypothetical protein